MNKCYVVMVYDQDYMGYVNEVVFLDPDTAVQYASDLYEDSYIEVINIVF